MIKSFELIRRYNYPNKRLCSFSKFVADLSNSGWAAFGTIKLVNAAMPIRLSAHSKVGATKTECNCPCLVLDLKRASHRDMIQ